MSEGDVGKSDDASVGDDEFILRRVPPGRFNPENGLPESSTFDNDSDGYGTSVTLWQSAEDLSNLLHDHDAFGVVAITVGEARAQGLVIERCEVPGNPNHCELHGPRPKSKKKALARLSRWVKHLDGFPEHLKAPAFELP